MPEQELSLLISLKDEATAQLKQLNKELESNARNWKEMFSSISAQARDAGMVLTGFGTVITGAFAFAYNASEKNRVATAKLSTDLKNLGVSYGMVKNEIDAFTAAAQKATGVSKGDQMAGLSQLLLVTGDYKKAMDILPIALDLAAAKQIEVTQAAILLGRVVEGDINALNRYGFSMDGVTSAGEALNVIQDKVKGSARAMLSPIDLLKNSLSDLAEAIGNLISGPSGDFIRRISEIVDAITAWTEANPEAARSLAEFIAAIGIGAIVTGTLGLAIAGLIFVFGALGTTVGLVLIWIGLLVAAGIWLITQWQWVRDNWVAVWAIIKAALVFFIGPIGYVIGLLIQSAFDIIAAWEPTRSFWENLWMGILMIVRNAVNDIIFLINLIPKALNSLYSILGQNPRFQLIPELNMGMLGYSGTANRAGWTPEQWEAFGGYGAGAAPGAGAVAPINTFGNYGNLGQTGVMQYGGTQITFNIQGDVTSEKDFFEKVRQYFIQLGYKNVTTGIR